MSSYIVSKIGELEAVEFPSVTTILKQLDKSGALIPWALGLAEKWNIEQLKLESGNISEARALEIVQSAKEQYKTVSGEAMDIGSQVHSIIERHIKMMLEQSGDIINPETIQNPSVKNGFKAFLEWEKENVISWIESESKIVDTVNGYAGTLDALVELKNGVYLLDFKTSKSCYPEYNLQLSGYKNARESMQGEYLFEHDYEVIEQGIKSKAYISTTKDYLPIKIAGIAILRLDKVTGQFEYKDVTKTYDKMLKAFICLTQFYYLFAKRRLKNNKWVNNAS